MDAALIARMREIKDQEFLNYALAVPVTPARIPIRPTQASTSPLYDAMIISVHEDAGSSVYFGGNGVIGGLTTNGLQIRPGIPITLNLHNMRPLYELQMPLLATGCADPLTIPLVVWNLNNCYLTADVAVTVAIILFQVPFK